MTFHLFALRSSSDVLNLRSRVLVDLSAQKYVLNMHLLTFLHYLYSKVIKCMNPYNPVILFTRWTSDLMKWAAYAPLSRSLKDLWPPEISLKRSHIPLNGSWTRWNGPLTPWNTPKNALDPRKWVLNPLKWASEPQTTGKWAMDLPKQAPWLCVIHWLIHRLFSLPTQVEPEKMTGFPSFLLWSCYLK